MRDIGIETFSMLLEIIENAMKERGGLRHIRSFLSIHFLFVFHGVIRVWPCTNG